MDFEGAKKYIINKLQKELKPDLSYHSIDHTLDVLQAAIRYAEMEGVNGYDLELIKAAALFHDAGFTEIYEGHEKASVRLAYETLPEFGYTNEDIKLIEGMILSTEIPQHPSTQLEKIIADADLDYIGRDDLFVIGQRLQYEWQLHGKVSSLREWHEKQLEFLKNHKYFTKSAKKLRNNKKQENIMELENLLHLKK
ncbi:MAG: HD domain-containing protein [Bacteroidales bacterium]|nr:HD domain-containing protein [Bacteroidales bacterium]